MLSLRSLPDSVLVGAPAAVAYRVRALGDTDAVAVFPATGGRDSVVVVVTGQGIALVSATSVQRVGFSQLTGAQASGGQAVILSAVDGSEHTLELRNRQARDELLGYLTSPEKVEAQMQQSSETVATAATEEPRSRPSAAPGVSPVFAAPSTSLGRPAQGPGWETFTLSPAVDPRGIVSVVRLALAWGFGLLVAGAVLILIGQPDSSDLSDDGSPVTQALGVLAAAVGSLAVSVGIGVIVVRLGVSWALASLQVKRGS